jgi:succinoglycan biosynthesis protein ExoL
MKKLVFLSNNWFDSHQQMRLTALTKLALSIECKAFDREDCPIRPTFPYVKLGTIKNRRYFQRLPHYFRLLYQLPKATESADFTYIYGFDLFLITLLYRKWSRRKFEIIYEVTDIRELFFSKTFSGKLVRFLERISIPSADLVVVTSPEYITEYFINCRDITIKNHLVIENKIHERHPPSPSSKQGKKIRIGYFGFLRCPVSLECLLTLADYYQFEILLAGIFTDDTNDYALRIIHHPTITYLGNFDGLNELPSLYSQIDFVWAIYPFSIKKTGNHRWARTNRFYESLYFQKPAIVQKGTADARFCKNLGEIAVEIDLTDKQSAVKHILKTLTPNRLESHKKRLAQVHTENYLITSEYNQLAQCLNLTKF